MLRIVLALVFAAIASTYPTDNPISESPNILLGPSDESDSPSVASSGDALLNTLAAAMDDCEPDSEEENEDRAPTASKRPDEDMLSTVTVRRCPSRNFVRFGRGRPDNFIRFGRGGKEDSNFIRFGRGKAGSNFIRLGRGGGGGSERGSDNFIRFGRARSSNFVRFGRGRPDNFIRFGRGRDNNFLRFGRSGAMEETAPLGSSMQVDEDNNQRVGRGGKSGSNFIRLGRAGSSSFIRLGRDGEDQVEDEDIEERETRGKNNANFLRFGRRTNNGNFLRFGRSSNSGELRRGKLTDRNFIRLGRAGGNTYGEDADTGSVRVARSEKSRGFIRLGKRRSSEDYEERADSHLLRLGRDVEEIQEPPVLPSSEVTDDNDTSSRTRRSVPYPKPEDEEAQEGSYPVIIATSSGNSGNEDKVDSSLRYYSPLAPSGIPNYILAPELSLLAPLSGAESPNKRGRGDGHNRNYIRLG